MNRGLHSLAQMRRRLPSLLILGLAMGVLVSCEAPADEPNTPQPVTATAVTSADSRPASEETATPSSTPYSADWFAGRCIPQLYDYDLKEDWFYPTNPWVHIVNATYMESHVIVRATLLSLTDGTELVTCVPGAPFTYEYRLKRELRFRIHEYLEGSGPDEILVVVRENDVFTYATKAEALERGAELEAERNKTWDKHQAVLIVTLADDSDSSGASGSSEGSAIGTAEFAKGSPISPPTDFTIDTMNRAWLPAESSGAAGKDSDPALITDGSTTPYQTITVSDIKAKVASIHARLELGKGTPGYAECERGRDLQQLRDRDNKNIQFRRAKSIRSGSRSGTEIFKFPEPFLGDPAYSRLWLKGLDAGLFRAGKFDTDSSPANGYNLGFSTARPLPAGNYRVQDVGQHYSDIPCDHKPENDYVDWIITVNAPAGTLHEAFFDPVTIDALVGSVGSYGVLRPNTFTVSDKTTTTLRSIKYSNGVVRMQFSQTTDLANKEVQFIMLDGTVGLTLPFSSATTGTLSADTVYSWKTCTAPWSNGDKIMIRIRDKQTGGLSGTGEGGAVGQSATATPTPNCISVTPTQTPAPTATP